MAVLRPAPVSTRQLTWRPSVRQYVGEASSTRGFGRVYDDACDEGLTLVSARTGRAVVFAIYDAKYDGEGDLQAWRLRPAVGQRDVPADVELVLFND